MISQELYNKIQQEQFYKKDVGLGQKCALTELWEQLDLVLSPGDWQITILCHDVLWQCFLSGAWICC
jgi:hypothetical protein